MPNPPLESASVLGRVKGVTGFGTEREKGQWQRAQSCCPEAGGAGRGSTAIPEQVMGLDNGQASGCPARAP